MSGYFVTRHNRRIEVEDLEVPPQHKRTTRTHTTGATKDRFIGCPIWWLRRVRPAVTKRDQLVVAIYLWRRRVVCGNRETFDVPNGELKAWGISRKIKYRTLDLLAAAGLIKVARHSAKAALTVTILAKNRRGNGQ
jgi:hypothetical protein